MTPRPKASYHICLAFPAGQIDISRDGQWVTYITYPENTLWRMRMDGNEKLQMTYAQQVAAMPRWSPDGKQIAFVSLTPWSAYEGICDLCSGWHRDRVPAPTTKIVKTTPPGRRWKECHHRRISAAEFWRKHQRLLHGAARSTNQENFDASRLCWTMGSALVSEWPLHCCVHG